MRGNLLGMVVAAVVLAATALDLHADPSLPIEISESWIRLNDPTITPTARDDAEAVLRASNSAMLVPLVFASLDAPIGEYSMKRITESPLASQSTAVDIDRLCADRAMSPALQIGCARDRLWRHLCNAAEPKADRDRLLAECLQSEASPRQEYLLIRTPWNDGLHRFQSALFECFADPSRRSGVRRAAGDHLLSNKESRSIYYERVLREAWSDRHDESGPFISASLLLSGSALAYAPPGPVDPRAAVLVMEDLQRQIDRGREPDHRIASALIASTDTPARKAKQGSELEPPFIPKEKIREAFLDWSARNSARLEAEAAAKAVEAVEKRKAEAPEGER